MNNNDQEQNKKVFVNDKNTILNTKSNYEYNHQVGKYKGISRNELILFDKNRRIRNIEFYKSIMPLVKFFSTLFVITIFTISCIKVTYGEKYFRKLFFNYVLDLDIKENNNDRKPSNK